MGRSNIEWLARPGTDPETWNPVTGCSHVSPGCDHCYARHLAQGRLRGRVGYDQDHPFQVTTHRDRLCEPFHWRKPRTCFVVSMGDLFHPLVPWSFVRDIWDVMEASPKHTFIVCTKRPDRLYWFLTTSGGRLVDGYRPPAPNVWGLVSVEDQERADQRIHWLLRSPLQVRGLSVEPLLGPVDLSAIPFKGDVPYYLDVLRGRYSENPERTEIGNIFAHGLASLRTLDWVIVGGETGKDARPMRPVWVHNLLRQCAESHTPFFFKSWGEWGDHYTPFAKRWCVWDQRGDPQVTKYPYVAKGWNGQGKVVQSRVTRSRSGHELGSQVIRQWPTPPQVAAEPERDGPYGYGQIKDSRPERLVAV